MSKGSKWCGRDDCPACQGYSEPPPMAKESAPDCPWLAEPLPDDVRWEGDDDV